MNANPTPRVSLAILRLAIAYLLGAGTQVTTKMTGNASFIAPFPALIDVTAAIAALDAANQAAMGGDRLAIAERKTARAALLSLLRQLAAYVQAHCQESREVIISSGFEPTHTPTPVGQLSPPAAPVLRHGKTTGSIALRIVKPNGATSTNWRIALAATPTVYLQTTSTSSGRTLFTGLTAGELYSAQASVVGAMGESGWSAPSILMSL
jgi:hypothetical protein